MAPGLSGPATRLVVSHDGRELAGVVREDESWLAAARRTSATVTGDPVPLDLSADPQRWLVDRDRVVTLRPMSRGDLPVVARWLTNPHVAKWWHTEGSPSLAAVTERYGPDIDGLTPTRRWVVEVNGRSMGFVQDYRVGDHPDFALLAPDPDAIGCDYVIGEPEWVGRGMGTRAVWAWLLKNAHRRPDSTTCFAAPDHRNAASLRMLDKLGFVRGLWFDEPSSSGSVTTCVGCSLDVRRVVGSPDEARSRA